MAKRWPPPGFPLVEGAHRLTPQWALTLPTPFARRIEEGSLVLWRPGLTLWVDAWGNDRSESRADRLSALIARASPDARVVRDAKGDNLTRYAYRLRDTNPDGEVESLNALVISETGHLQVGIYFDDLGDEAVALAIVNSVAWTPPSGARP